MPALEPFLRERDAAGFIGPRIGDLLGRPARLEGLRILHAWRRSYTKPQRQTDAYLRVCYEMTLSDANGELTPRLVHGTVHRRRPDGRALRHAEGAQQLLANDDVCFAAQVFPADHGLPQLAACYDGEALRRRLPDAVAAELGQLARLSITVASYRPGERCTLRIGNGAATVYLKLFRPSAAAAIAQRWQELGAQHGASRFPVLLAICPADDALWFSAAKGINARDALRARRYNDAMPAIAAALADLHGREANDSVVSPCDRAVLVVEAQRKLRKMLTAQLIDDELCGRVGVTLGQENAAIPQRQSRLLHGDVHAGQFVLDAGHAKVLDLDEMTAGEIERDLAMLIVDTLFADLGCVPPAAAISTLLARYTRHAVEAPDQRLLDWYCRLSLIDRAYRDYWRFGRQAAARCRAILSRAAGSGREVWR
ncbi:MAG: phosphotransferase [Steroidobacteraceae bacterium]